MQIFLLGGCDLEMLAIKRLLKKYNKIFFDKNLKWGAKLSEYEDIIKKHKNDTIYAIELEKDVDFDNVILIDHHNEFSKNPSSIEQVAKILNHKLSRFEKAVAINDTSYIDGLIKAGFNKSDIKRIRALDRKAQGVDDRVEKAANEIKLERIMEFNFSHFSPLNDRIYFEKGWKKYIIFNDNLTMFYGFDIEKLKEELKKVGIEKIFYGGGEKGFLGIERKLDIHFLRKVYEKMKKAISTHIFMLPFVVKKSEEFFEKIREKGWKKEAFKIDRVEYYNEFIYFLPHVRDVLYGFDENLSKYYEYPLNKDKENKFIVELKDSKVYSLDIEDISLRIFNDSIGILSLHLNNYDYDESYDILKINEFARRIFPQFLDKNNFVEGTKYSFLADEIKIILNSKEFSKDDFNEFSKDNFKNFKNLNIKEIEKKLLPNYITNLIDENIELVLDDRMFVVSFYLDEKSKIIKNLKEFDKKSNEYGYVNNDWWYMSYYNTVEIDNCYKNSRSYTKGKRMSISEMQER